MFKNREGIQRILCLKRWYCLLWFLLGIRHSCQGPASCHMPAISMLRSLKQEFRVAWATQYELSTQKHHRLLARSGVTHSEDNEHEVVRWEHTCAHLLQSLRKDAQSFDTVTWFCCLKTCWMIVKPVLGYTLPKGCRLNMIMQIISRLL